MCAQRYHRRSRRRKRDVPVISLVGYNQCRKSTLLNTLTKSEIQAEDLLFATLDPLREGLRSRGYGGDHHRYRGLYPQPPG